MKTFTAAAMAALYAASPAAAIVRNCPDGNSGGCFSWGTPQTTSTNSVYFSISAPTSYEWIGLGLGRGMSGAEMFLVYQDGSGNVTLSTRSAAGHVPPDYRQRDGVELLAGSGVKDGQMVANVKCSGTCSKNMNRAGSNNWIAAWKTGGSLQSTSLSADISQHDNVFNFGIDLSKATINSDSNPFVGSSNTGNTNGNGNGNSGSISGGNTGVTTGSSAVSTKVLTAHGVVMAITFAFLYPVGAILMPMLGKWLIHGVAQIVAFLMMWAGFGLGYYYSSKLNTFWNDTHMKIGTITVALLGIQPILGWLHHAAYKRYQRRTIISHVHIWYGRALMVLGIVNGGLGLREAQAENKFKIAYAVIAGVFGGMYIGAAVWGIIKRSKAAPRTTSKGSGESG